MPTDVKEHYQKPQGPVRMVWKKVTDMKLVCGYAGMFMDLSPDNWDGVYG